MKVLLATDGSKEAMTALDTANSLIRPAERHFDLLCVAPRLPKKRQPATPRNGYEQLVLREMTHILAAARATFASKGTTTNLITEIGSPSASIVSRAEDYDLIVIGARGRGTLGEVGLGPVASRVVEHARGHIFVARRLRNEEGPRVLAAVDGSAAAFHAVEILGELFDLGAAEVCLMHVTETPWTEFGLEQDWVTYSEEDKERSEAGLLERELVREGKTVLEKARDLLRPHCDFVSTRVDEGNPANEILREAECGQYDLIVLGATGARDLKHQMLGSVSSKVAWNASCSVLIVREPE